MLKISSNNS